MALNEVRVKNEPIYDSQSISETRETKHLIKHERKSISINDSKLTRESISSDHSNNEQPNKDKRQLIDSMRIKEEPIDIEMKKSKSHIESRSEEEVEIKAEEKYSATEEFINKTSIAFLNEETTTSIEDTPTTSNSQSIKSNKLEKSK